MRWTALRVAARAVEGRLNADTTDNVGPTAPCACGHAARYAGRRPKTVESALGTLTLERALLRELASVDVPSKQVERAAEALGREIAEDEQHVVEPPPAAQSLASTLYLGMDGRGVPVRKEELMDCPGKQPDRSAKTREVKLVTVWSAEERDEEGTPVRDAGSISYSAAIESAAQKDTDATSSQFAARVEREATRRGFDRAARRVVLGDGAKWIWNLADEHFPRRSRSSTGSMRNSISPT